MKITKRQLRKLVLEYTRDPMERYYASVVEDYESWVKEMGHITPSASSVLATYLIDQGFESDAERISILASGYKIDKTDIVLELKRQLASRDIREAEGSTEKYDDDSALKGDQSKLPDALQKGIIDKTVEDREEKEKNESKTMKITKRQLRKVIKEEKDKILSEMNPDGTISGDEDEARYDLLANVEGQIDELIQLIRDESERIGGGFRGPGIRREALKLLADKIYEAR
jgi:hypothetical protein